MPITPSPNILFAGGGTAGHLMPGLAVARCLDRLVPGTRVVFVGSGKPQERKLIEAAGFEYRGLPCAPGPARLNNLVPSIWSNLRGLAGAGRIMFRETFDVVVGLGGYASLPAAQTAAGLRTPLMLLEQNLVPGRATRWLARWARAVCVTFDETRLELPKSCRVVVTGNPLRPEFATARRTSSLQQLVILGGSGGARPLNQAVPGALARLGDRLQNWRVVHQSGQADLESTRTLYRTKGIEAEVLPFVQDMPDLLANSDLAISRAGGTTLAELAMTAVPSILIPYPQAADDHQRRNAQQASRGGGCIVVEQGLPDFEKRLSESLESLLSDPLARQRMARAMNRLARPDAAEQVAHLILAICRQQPIGVMESYQKPASRAA